MRRAFLLLLPVLLMGATTPVIQPNVSLTTTVNAAYSSAGSTADLDVSGCQGAGMSVPSSSTLISTLTPYCSADNGTTFVQTQFLNSDNSGNVLATQTTASGTSYVLPVVLPPGCRKLQIRATSYTSGSAAIVLSCGQASMLGNSVAASGAASNGSAVTGNPVLVGGSDGTNVRNLKTDTAGALATYTLPLSNGKLGAYCAAAITGTMAAGIASNAPIYAFRWTTTNTAVIRSITFAHTSLGTGFTAGVGQLKLIAARSFSASDTGGNAVTLTTNNAKLRTSDATATVGDVRLSSTAALGTGTRTMDTTPLNHLIWGVNTTANATQLATTTIWPPLQGTGTGSMWPIVLAQNEGFELQVTVPATGTWQGIVTTCWEELSSF